MNSVRTFVDQLCEEVEARTAMRKRDRPRAESDQPAIFFLAALTT